MQVVAAMLDMSTRDKETHAAEVRTEVQTKSYRLLLWLGRDRTKEATGFRAA
jgi:hypothetical protein